MKIANSENISDAEDEEEENDNYLLQIICTALGYNLSNKSFFPELLTKLALLTAQEITGQDHLYFQAKKKKQQRLSKLKKKKKFIEWRKEQKAGRSRKQKMWLLNLFVESNI